MENNINNGINNKNTETNELSKEIDPFIESSNKYVKAFKEACEKLEEDDGNPSVLQAIDYDIDNDEVNYDEDIKPIVEKLDDLMWKFFDLKKKYPNNKRINEATKKLIDTIEHLVNEFAKKSPYHNNYVGSYVTPLGDEISWDLPNGIEYKQQ